MFVWLLFSLALACPSSNGSFVPVSFHVSYWNTQSTSSHHLAVFFPGFSVLLEDSEVWVETLVNANLVSSTQHVFATAGPEDPLFKKREIDTKLLASCVSSRVTPETNLLVFAHSSGAFVAYSFLNEFFKLGPALNSSTYYCLDGGVLGFTPAMLQNLTRVVAVNAQDSQSGIKSRNFDVMTGLSKWDPPKTSLFTCSVKTICQNYNCVHDSVINRWPHNATTFDLHYDYNVDMNESSVQTDYLN